MLVTIKLREQQSIVYEQEEHALRVLMEKSSTRKWPGRKREEVRRTPTSRLACYTVGNIHVHSMHEQNLNVCWLSILSVGTIGEGQRVRWGGTYLSFLSFFQLQDHPYSHTHLQSHSSHLPWSHTHYLHLFLWQHH